MFSRTSKDVFEYPRRYEYSRLNTTVLDNWLTDGAEVVSLTHQPAALYPREHSWYSFLSEAVSNLGP
jgi:hypothetical protein